MIAQLPCWSLSWNLKRFSFVEGYLWTNLVYCLEAALHQLFICWRGRWWIHQFSQFVTLTYFLGMYRTCWIHAFNNDHFYIFKTALVVFGVYFVTDHCVLTLFNSTKCKRIQLQLVVKFLVPRKKMDCQIEINTQTQFDWVIQCIFEVDDISRSLFQSYVCVELVLMCLPWHVFQHAI